MAARLVQGLKWWLRDGGTLMQAKRLLKLVEWISLKSFFKNIKKRVNEHIRRKRKEQK